MLSSVIAALSLAGLLWGLWAAWKRHREFPARLASHHALVSRLGAAWARVVHCDVVGSRSSDDGITHYEVALELLGWLAEPFGAGNDREGPRGERPWSVRWVLDAGVVGHLVAGSYIGLTYDRIAPANTGTLFPQRLVTLPGAVLPLHRG
ncbi:MAG: hypothetical protein EOP08_08175 [Proteobacteria bacterium]|nr:MAG: hypothetical protein EOP08_08175 [Pseudomonadota bacterium]